MSQSSAPVADSPSSPRQCMLRVGVINSDLSARDADGNLLYYPANGRLMQALLERLPKARMCANVIERQPGMSHLVRWPLADVVEMPPIQTTIQAQKKYFAVNRAIREFVKTVDVLLVRLPCQVPRAVLGLGKPKVMQIVNDPVEIVAASTDYRGPMRWFANWFAGHSMATMRRMAHEPNTRTVAHGRELWEKMGRPPGRVIVSSGLYEREMRPKSDLSLNDPPRLLFVGYLRPEKGAEVLLEAFERVRGRRPLKLTLAGQTDRNSQSEARINAHIANSKYAADIERVGKVEFGEPLFNLYRQHDINVLPSLSDATPRTLVEARAFGCAVVASRVGGVPTSIEDGRDGLLVPPGDPGALAETIERLLDDDVLRRRLVEEGIRRSKQMSVERFADQLVEELQLLAPMVSNSVVQ